MPGGTGDPPDIIHHMETTDLKLIETIQPRSTALIALLALMSSAANAGEDAHGAAHATSSDYYIHLRGNANFLDDAANGANGVGTLGNRTDFDTGFGLSGAVGRDLSRFLSGSLTNFRAEAEIAYGENGIGSLTGNPEVRTYAYMANLYYDFQPLGHHRSVVPYIGVGIGAASLNVDGAPLADDEDTVFAYQVRAGFAYGIRPDLSLSVGYRFFDAGDPEFAGALGRFDSEYRSHAVEAGLSYRF